MASVFVCLCFGTRHKQLTSTQFEDAWPDIRRPIRNGWRPQSGYKKQSKQTMRAEMRKYEKDFIYYFSVCIYIGTSGCGAKKPVTDKVNDGTTSESKQSQNTDGPQMSNETATGTKRCRPAFPMKLCPLQQMLRSLDVRENHANNGLEVSYVSDNDIHAL